MLRIFFVSFNALIVITFADSTILLPRVLELEMRRQPCAKNLSLLNYLLSWKTTFPLIFESASAPVAMPHFLAPTINLNFGLELWNCCLANYIQALCSYSNSSHWRYVSQQYFVMVKKSLYNTLRLMNHPVFSNTILCRIYYTEDLFAFNVFRIICLEVWKNIILEGGSPHLEDDQNCRFYTRSILHLGSMQMSI